MVQKYKNTQWTRVDWSQIEVTAKPEDVKATWRAQIPGDVWLTPNYAYLQKCPKLDNPKMDKSIIDRRKFKLIIMDETDRAIADSLTDFQPSPLALTEKSETGMSEKSIDWLLSFSWFYQKFQEVQKGRRQKKKKQFYVRVIPEVDIGNDRVEEPRVLTDEIFEFLHVARIQQGESENQNIQRQIRTDLKLCKGALHTITLPELYDIMEKFDIDKSQFTLIDDPVHMISMEDCARTGVPVKTFSAEGEPIMSHSQAMLYMIQSLICGFQWSTATPAARENWADYIRKCRWSWPANCYLEVKDVLHQIMFLKQQKRAAFEKQIKMKEYLILGVNGDQYLKSSKAYKTYAQQIGLPENAFVGKCAPIWTLRIHSVYSALDHFVTDLEDCDMIKRLTVEGIFSMMPVQHKGMFTEYFNGANIYDIYDQANERCRVFARLEHVPYQFHFHNKFVQKGTSSRRAVRWDLPKFKTYQYSFCAQKPKDFQDSENLSDVVTSSEVSKIQKPKKSRCTKCRSSRKRVINLRFHLKGERRSRQKFEEHKKYDMGTHAEILKEMDQNIQDSIRYIKLLDMEQKGERMGKQLNQQMERGRNLKFTIHNELKVLESIKSENDRLRQEEQNLLVQLKIEELTATIQKTSEASEGFQKIQKTPKSPEKTSTDFEGFQETSQDLEDVEKMQKTQESPKNASKDSDEIQKTSEEIQTTSKDSEVVRKIPDIPDGVQKTLDAAEEIPTTSIDSEDFQKTPESPKSPEKMSEDSQDVQEALGFLDKIQKTSEDSESSDAKEEEDLLKETLELEALLKEMDPDDDSESYSNPEIETTVIQKPEESVATVIQNTVIQDNVELPKTEESLDGILEKLMKLEISATVIPSATVTQMTPSESGVLNLQMSNDSEDVDAVGTMTTVPSPSSVPDDPSYSNPIDAEQLRMEIEEKNAKIEELELLNKQLLERAEHMGQLLSQNQNASSETEEKLKSEILKANLKISNLEESNNELRYKVKHHEEIIDKFMKRMTAENKD
ncbi:hypothetical protein L3Y34_000491 [Caenorhabditis briggsae]|uniref:Uncharacterized protein n=2 Tax=Caenorhabditis briggsae TaxID=6238 RepID=A0AAE9D9P7_CAEBR|nr:hypothetical protein L3Y34_000491 [Caenorhabditis briggsae]